MTHPDPSQGVIAGRNRFEWKTAALVLSLVINLFVFGAIAARFLHPPRHFVNETYAQLIPRGFLANLDVERRRELLGILRKYGEDFKGGRANARRLAGELANALEAEPYDHQRVIAAIEGYSGAGRELVSKGKDVALEFYAALSPEERRQIARQLRQPKWSGHRN